jgi:hypothetical protein
MLPHMSHSYQDSHESYNAPHSYSNEGPIGVITARVREVISWVARDQVVTGRGSHLESW